MNDAKTTPARFLELAERHMFWARKNASGGTYGEQRISDNGAVGGMWRHDMVSGPIVRYQDRRYSIRGFKVAVGFVELVAPTTKAIAARELAGMLAVIDANTPERHRVSG